MADQLVENNVFQNSGPQQPVVSAVDQYSAHGVFSINASNQLKGTLWVTKNGELVTSSLGTASYTVYDASGATVGITEAGLIANAQGQYITTPVSASAIIDLTHYVVKISISLDGNDRIAYTGIALGE